MKPGTSTGLWVLAALSLIGTTTIQLMQHSDPATFSSLTFALIGAAAGIAVPAPAVPAAAIVAPSPSPTTVTVTPIVP